MAFVAATRLMRVSLFLGCGVAKSVVLWQSVASARAAPASTRLRSRHGALPADTRCRQIRGARGAREHCPCARRPPRGGHTHTPCLLRVPDACPVRLPRPVGP
eukprot:6790441-Prymnesium_polylepis.1